MDCVVSGLLMCVKEGKFTKKNGDVTRQVELDLYNGGSIQRITGPIDMLSIFKVDATKEITFPIRVTEFKGASGTIVFKSLI